MPRCPGGDSRCFAACRQLARQISLRIFMHSKHKRNRERKQGIINHANIHSHIHTLPQSFAGAAAIAPRGTQGNEHPQMIRAPLPKPIIPHRLAAHNLPPPPHSLCGLTGEPAYWQCFRLRRVVLLAMMGLTSIGGCRAATKKPHTLTHVLRT